MTDRIMWSGYEFEYREKAADWFWAVSILVISFATIAIIYDNVLFGVFIVIAGGMIFATARREPRYFHYELTDKGLLVNDKLTLYVDFEGFAVTDSKFAPPKLLLRTKKWANPVLAIPIETDYVDASKVRDFLLDYIPEEDIHEPVSIRFMEFLGF